MVNILKKYSRAAGDRSHWVKAEAMFDQTPKGARCDFLRGVSHVHRSPLRHGKHDEHNNASTNTATRS